MGRWPLLFLLFTSGGATAPSAAPPAPAPAPVAAPATGNGAHGEHDAHRPTAAEVAAKAMERAVAAEAAAKARAGNQASPPAPSVEAGPAPAPPGSPARPAAPSKLVVGAPAEEKAPPPLNVEALRDEIRRSGPDEGTLLRRERERLEQLAAEINKSREALRQDTARLESMLAKKDGAARAAAAAVVEGPDGKKAPLPLETLAKAMRGMKPQQAAPIVTRLDRKLAADVLQKMPAPDAGKVMGQLAPEVAAEIAAEIASRQPRPEAP